ncbi:glycerol-3-phosphate dehydrogenase [bacterium (candidate division B38) B3_B38]|nr:MAG: glycerol-3-phosphate dehydrogenase [bacterium (candidate division B38) B3_B38]
MKNITIIGAGGWGTALAIHLSKQGYQVKLWVYEKDLAERMSRSRENDLYLPGFTIPESVTPSNSFQEAIEGAEVLLSVMPSHLCRSVYQQMLPYLHKDLVFISATKGIEEGTMMRMSQVIRSVIGERFEPRIAVLSGPTFAREVASETPTAVVIASEEPSLARMIQQGFSCPYFRFYTSSDVIGLELAGAVKNIIAIASGIVTGLGYGHNTIAALITRGLAEMMRLTQALGGRPETLAGLAGIGDLVLTCTGALSRNRRVGQRLGRGEKLASITKGMQMVAEGVHTSRAVSQLGEKLGVELPITAQVYAVLYQDKDPRQALAELMQRELKEE